MSNQSNSSSGSGEARALGDGIARMRKLAEELGNIYIERHEYRDATDADFKDRDRAWYDSAAGELTGLGYRRLGEVVNETVAKAAGLVVVIRRFVSGDGMTMAAIYQFVRPNRVTGKSVDLRLCDVESEFSDGSFLTTSNAEAARAASMPPQIRSTKYPATTTIPELIALHDAARRKLLSEQPSLRGIEIRTADEYQAAQHRQEAIKAAFRRGIGYLDPAEVRRIAEQKRPGDPLGAVIPEAMANIARGQMQAEKAGRPSASTLLSLMTAREEGKSPEDVAKLAAEAMLSRLPGDLPASKRDEIADTIKNLSAAAESQDHKAGLTGLFTLMGQLQQLQPNEEKERKRKQFEESMARAQAEHEKRQAAHVKERLARGLSESAGTGDAAPKIYLRQLPIPQLDYEDKPRNLTAMVQEINASKSRRDAKVLAGLPLGHSRIGGLPDLPPGQAWPTHEGKKIPFIAQINLADVPRSADSLLPERGQLYAFALISNEKEHWPPPVSVLLFQGDPASLRRADAPADDEIWPDWTDERVYEVLPAAPVAPEPRTSGASADADAVDDDDDENEPDEVIAWLGGKMSDVFGTPGEIADGRFEDGDDWIHLLGVHSAGSMQWSDCGHLYFLIRRSALKSLDFSNVLAEACSS